MHLVVQVHNTKQRSCRTQASPPRKPAHPATPTYELPPPLNPSNPAEQLTSVSASLW